VVGLGQLDRDHVRSLARWLEEGLRPAVVGELGGGVQQLLEGGLVGRNQVLLLEVVGVA
jgi:hypothetical protein